MLVLDERPAARVSPSSPRTREDRQLAVEGHELLEDQRHAAEGGPRRVDVGGIAQHVLALAVVAAAPRLEHRGESDRLDRAVEAGAVVDRLERGDAGSRDA